MQELLNFMQQHWMLTTALLAVLLLLIILEFIRQRQGGARLSPSQVTNLMNHENATVVDIRSTELYTNGHILNSLSVPAKDIEKSKKLEKLKSQPVILVCENGIESQRAANALINQGFKVYILNGGLRAWREANLPLVKG